MFWYVCETKVYVHAIQLTAKFKVQENDKVAIFCNDLYLFLINDVHDKNPLYNKAANTQWSLFH